MPLLALIVFESLMAFLFALPVKLLWNTCLVPALHINEIAYDQAFGIYVLCILLFKNNRSA